MIKILLCLLALGQATAVHAAKAVLPESELYLQIERLDNIVFDQAFNRCEFTGLAEIIAEDLEFYHDESGIMHGREALLKSYTDGICSLDYKATRKLVEDSMRVYPLKREGVLYGAIQEGEHEFYAQSGDVAPKHTSTAKFTHVWLLQQDSWKLKRILSYAHH